MLLDDVGSRGVASICIALSMGQAKNVTLGGKPYKALLVSFS